MSQQYPQSASTEGLRDRSLLGRVEDHASNNFPALLSHTVEDENDDEDLHTDLEQLSLRKDEPVLRGAPRIMGWTTTWQMVALTICLAGYVLLFPGSPASRSRY
ncbi:hypothetical protein BC938DRAFT_478256 [Jimgerdemannia flammicorona]|uniref:Uncharacterized protein n=1 Tax=Jimgerdemannia flammicorona TaxID=994334 RepID=A0A433P5Z9_9FUNG|nr:hypothetical protein BC938DRAFT_478256 [Jimgerdemannia flammicorona]